MKKQIAIIGSGNWGSVVAKMIAENVVCHDAFSSQVKMWVHEEIIDGQKLTDIIRITRENIKYCPNVLIPDCVELSSDLAQVCRDADYLIFVLPHQFLEPLFPILKENIKHKNVHGVSLIKGAYIKNKKLVLVSDVIKSNLGIQMSTLMGANVAKDVGKEQFSESTLGCANQTVAKELRTLFYRPYFLVESVSDVKGVELCGALKNIVALGAGFVDGLKWGENTKAAAIRIGLEEMRRFARHYFPEVEEETYFQSCGVADLITTCFGGRNRLCAEHFVLKKQSFKELEKELLGGQKLQGLSTLEVVIEMLESENIVENYPFFHHLHQIIHRQRKPEALFDFGEKHV